MARVLGIVRHQLIGLLPARLRDHLRKRKRQRAAALRRQLRDRRIEDHGQFDAQELVSALHGLGVRSGGVLLVQSSFNDLHTFSGRPADLLSAMRSLAGPQGTLMMPAYTTERYSSEPFALEALPTYTGIVNELFRRTPGVRRSLHPRHSLCAIGPLAGELLDRHEACLYADGPGSPFDRLRMRDDAWIITLGLPSAFTSFLHWIEDIEPQRLPFPVHEPDAKRYLMRRQDGAVIEVWDMQVRPDVASRLDLARVARALGPDAMRMQQLRGVDIGVYAVKPLSEQLVALRDQGIFHYH